MLGSPMVAFTLFVVFVYLLKKPTQKKRCPSQNMVTGLPSMPDPALNGSQA